MEICIFPVIVILQQEIIGPHIFMLPKLITGTFLLGDAGLNVFVA